MSGGRHRKKKAPRPLGGRTVRHIMAVISPALDKAVRWKLIKSNTMDFCDLPTPQKKQAKALDAARTLWFIDAARSHPYAHPIIELDSATGCWRGELLALTWPDLSDRDEAKLR